MMWFIKLVYCCSFKIKIADVASDHKRLKELIDGMKKAMRAENPKF